MEGVSLEQAASARAPAVAGSAEEKKEVVAVMHELDFETVGSAAGLVMPSAASCELVSSGPLRLLVTPPTSAGFVRISVVSDDEGESDAEEDATAPAATGGGAGGSFSRVAIVEDSGSEEEEGEGEEAPPAAQSAVSAEELKDAGNEFLKANKVREAVQAYTDSLAIDPTFVAALNNRAQAHLALKVRLGSGLCFARLCVT